MRLALPLSFFVSTVLLGATALAAPPADGDGAGADGSASVSLSSTSGADADGSAGADSNPDAGASSSWFRRYRPRANSWELGVYGGVWLPSRSIELHEPTLDFGGYNRAAPDFGVRAGYYPLRHFGLEGELSLMPTGVAAGGRGLVVNARAHGVLQLGIGRVVPFAVLGGGVLAVRSDATEAGSNADESLHVGGGVKFWATRRLLLRLDIRDIMSPQQGITPVAPAHNLEVLLGLSVALGPRPKAPPPPGDFDGDGVVDPDDACPRVAGDAPDGCPFPDTDLDGWVDPEDACPQDAGTAPDGCPVRDSDGDGYLDPDDGCPDEVGVDPDGCPLRDVDGDGLLPPEDACPEQPETVNGFEDHDGCPDELPEEVAKFTGAIEGIFFATGKSTIRSKSFPVLDQAADVLNRYPELRVRISGHTDNRGKHDKNVKLSQDRADAVRDYLVEHGIDTARIETRGAGPDEPKATNDTKEGRAENRRIEFEVLHD